jgi:DNA recombination protein RmuC
VVAAFLAGRAASGAGVDRRLATTERRLLDQLERLRDATASARREDVALATRGTRDVERAVERGFRELLAANDKKLEAMRATVDEKLGATLEARLGESFRLVSERLEQVHRGLGEMQKLAAGVGALERVLSNVRSRGTLGEAQLGTLLEQVMSPEQLATNVVTVPGSSERVEFAIKLPGREGEGPLLLPIDAKFPQEDYVRMQQAIDANDAPAVAEARRALARRALVEAETIRRKYVAPPHTTDFAILFVPTEGLFAEILRVPGLAESLHTKHRIMVAGPTTLYALLSSLQMGFRALAIERRGAEVWKVLGSVKTEFVRFGSSLDAVSKKLHEATSKLDETARRTRAMERALRDVEATPEETPRLALVPGEE